MALQVPDPRLGRATFADLVSLAAALVQERFRPFLLAGLVYTVPQAVTGAKLQYELARLGTLAEDLESFSDLDWSSISGSGVWIGIGILLFVLVMPVLDAVLVRASLDTLSGGNRPLQEISDNIPWLPAIGLDLVRLLAVFGPIAGTAAFFGAAVFALNRLDLGAGGSLLLFACGLSVLPLMMFGILYCSARLLVAKACYVMGRGTAGDSLSESWRLMGGRAGPGLSGLHWMRGVFMVLTLLALQTGAGILIAGPAQAFIGEAGAGYLDFLLAGLLVAPVQAVLQAAGAAAEAVYFADLAERHRPPPPPEPVPEPSTPPVLAPPSAPDSIPMA